MRLHIAVLVTELKQVKKIRLYEQMKYLFVNDFFIVFQTSRGDYLIDIRVNSRMLYADHDTVRGCVIGKKFELPEPQLEELRVLGDAPGENQFLPKEN